MAKLTDKVTELEEKLKRAERARDKARAEVLAQKKYMNVLEKLAKVDK